MIYEQFWDERRWLAQQARAALQPLDVAVLCCDVSRPAPIGPLTRAILRDHAVRFCRQDEALRMPMLEPACMDRGS